MKISWWATLLSACPLMLPVTAADHPPREPSSPTTETLETQFAAPPLQFRPETWFHLIGGNVGKPGITADLEAIKAAGIAGIQLFHGQFGGPWPGVVPQITCLSPQWDDIIRHVARETERLGLRFTMQNCPGWSMAGGPWITPPEAMRELVWSRTAVQGSRAGNSKLPQPQPSRESWRDYQDIATLAFPTPAGDDTPPLIPQTIHSNLSQLPWAAILNPTKKGSLKLEPTEEPTWVEVEFTAAVTLRAIQFPAVETFTMRHHFDPAVFIRIQAVTETGRVDIARREIPRSNWQDDRPLTLALPETTAQAFRITFENKHALTIDRLLLLSAARVDDWEGQAAFVLRSLDHVPALPQSRTAWITPERILDISDRMSPDGSLAWLPPDGGAWTVLRFGHVNTGAHNAPAPPEATGFECNKFSAVAAEKHFDAYIGRISAPNGPAGASLHGMVMDSWECHTQTWTADMEAEFAQYGGYALRPWLPALAGYVVGNHVTSERFLRDWRATVNALYVENFFGTMARLAHQRGLTLSFETAMGDVAPGDILQYFKHADVPMCEFWQPNDPHWGGEECKPILPCVSAAHIYGKPRIAAEAFTSVVLQWNEHPGMLKSLADHNFARGLNQLIFHTYTHNPRLDVVPGTSFGAGIGTPFLRGQTWWRHMHVFTDYLARCQFLLAQGHPVTDVLWYLGDELDHKPRQDTPFPSGQHFDYCNQDVLLHRITVTDGKLMTPEGLAWRVLWLPDDERLTPATLAKLHELLAAGATVIAAPPQGCATLSGGRTAEERFGALVKNMWGNATAASGDRRIGRGRLLWGLGLAEALARCHMAPDVVGAEQLDWCHRRKDSTDIYFVAAPRSSPLRGSLGFTAQGQPELFDPLTGHTHPATVMSHDGSHTWVALDLPASGSLFIVFRPGPPDAAAVRIERNGQAVMDAAAGRMTPPTQTTASHPVCELLDNRHLLAWENGRYRITPATGPACEVVATSTQSRPLTGPWILGIPNAATLYFTLPELQPWSALGSAALAHYSGTMSYACETTLAASSPNARYLLDLGEVANLADITVNDQPVGVLWTAPYCIDITRHVRPGINRIVVKVTNTWRNRLIYDAALPEKERTTWTLAGPPPNAPLEPAGLIGPVQLLTGTVLATEATP